MSESGSEPGTPRRKPAPQRKHQYRKNVIPLRNMPRQYKPWISLLMIVAGLFVLGALGCLISVATKGDDWTSNGKPPYASQDAEACEGHDNTVDASAIRADRDYAEVTGRAVCLQSRAKVEVFYRIQKHAVSQGQHSGYYHRLYDAALPLEADGSFRVDRDLHGFTVSSDQESSLVFVVVPEERSNALPDAPSFTTLPGGLKSAASIPVVTG